MQDFFQNLVIQLSSLKSLEGLGVFFGLLQVALAYFNSKWNFIAGILSTIIFIYLFGFTDIKLYADASLQFYYLLMSIYGLLKWSQIRNAKVLPITFTLQREWWITTVISVFGTVGIFLTLKNFTDSNVPFWDAIVTAIAWGGTWLMTRRKAEYWLVLNMSNLIAIPLFFYKGLYLTTTLTIVLFVVALLGYRKWKKEAIRSKIASLESSALS